MLIGREKWTFVKDLELQAIFVNSYQFMSERDTSFHSMKSDTVFLPYNDDGTQPQ